MVKSKLVFLMLLVFAGYLFAQTPLITTADPDTVTLASSYTVLLTGSNFFTGMTSDFGPDIIVTGTLRLSPGLARANIDVSAGAAIGPRDIIVTNPGGESDTLIGSFWVIPETDPPTVTLEWPSCGDTMACGDSAIVVELDDVSGIEPSSIEMEIGGVTYYTTSPELTLFGDSLLIWTPSGGFPEGLLDFALLDVADTLGNHIASPPFDCSVYIDTSGPVFTNFFPPIDGFTDDESPVIYAHVTDDYTEVDTSSLYFIVDSDTFYWGEAPVRWRNDTLFFYTSYAGISWEIGDTVEVCVGGGDIVEICGPNETEVCWEFALTWIPPTELNLEIESINPAHFPLITASCLVTDEHDEMIEHLDEDNFRVWVNSYEQYPLIVSSLGGGGAADIVWCIDTTGSMYSLIHEVRDNIHAFAESLSISGIDYRLGLVTFSDIVNFPHGYTLTPSVSTFQSWVAALGSSGGGDGPEVHFDAMVDALESMTFRPEARPVICLVSDAPYHYLGDGTSYSDETIASTMSALLSHDAIFFSIIDTDYTISSRPYEGVYWGPGSMTEETGGAFYEASVEFDTILTQIVGNIRGSYYVRWTSSHPVAACDVRDVEIEAFIEDLDLDDDAEMAYWAPCSPSALIVEPHPDTTSSHTYPISNRNDQRIILDFTEFELEDSIDESSIQLVVENQMYRITDPELTYDAPKLIFTPMTPWSHHQVIDVILARIMDSQGNLPVHGPIRWVWGSDLAAPEVSNRYPPPDTSIGDPYASVTFKLADDYSGLNEGSVLFTYSNLEGRSVFPPQVRTLSTTSLGVTWDGAYFTFDPTDAEPPIINGFMDTICVSVIRATDLPDYVDLDGGPNSMNVVEWCFAVLDDDTLCPEFVFAGPQTVGANQSFHIFMEIIDDLSGVYDPWDPADEQGVVLIYDTDGDLDDGYEGEVALSEVAPDTFRTDDPIPPLPESADFVFAVYACDNDTDGGFIDDRSCCWSDTFSIHVIFGPLTEIIYPKMNEVSTNEDQEIVMVITDSTQGVDSSSIIFGVNGIDHTVDGTVLQFSNDTMYFYPPTSEYFDDGMWVACSLKQALDNSGDSAVPVYWKFFVDLTPPVPSNLDPPPDNIVLDLGANVVARLRDEHREVDETTLELTLNDSVTYIWGDPGMYYDPVGEVFTFRPEDQDMLWPNNDSICLELSSADILPDYGDQNYMEPIRWCFFPSVTTCNYYPNPFTPNGDGINDIVSFTYPYMAMGIARIKIYDVENNPIYESEPGASIWDGRCNDGRIAVPGLYLFIIEHSNEIVCSGTILLVR